MDGLSDAGEDIGQGPNGHVFKVKRWGTVCAAKRLSDFCLQLNGKEKRRGGQEEDGEGGRGKIPFKQFEKECQLLNTIHHSNVVQFLGVYIERKTQTPVIVTEYLCSSLAGCLQKRPTIPLHLHLSMLHDVALGLAYLHGHTPAIAHGDLTAHNVLLTSNMVAKLADLAMDRLARLNPKKATQPYSRDRAAYMAPEVLHPLSLPPPPSSPSSSSSSSSSPTSLSLPPPLPRPNAKTDLFSLGVLMLHLVSQHWPHREPKETHAIVQGEEGALPSELSLRERCVELMGRGHCLYPVVEHCLHADPAQRPRAIQLCETLEELQRRHPPPASGYLDLLQVLESNMNLLEAKGIQLISNKDQLEICAQELDSKLQEIKALKQKTASLEKMVADGLKNMMLSPQVDKTVSPVASTSIVPTQNSFTWKRDGDMLVGMFGARGVVLEENVYVGGGDTKGLEGDCVVYEYDVGGVVRKWTPLPPSPVAYFAMAVVNKTLTLVGGLDVEKKVSTNQLWVWDRELQRWTLPFPAMPTPRQDSATTTHQLWLLVAGGTNFKKPVFNVELLDCATFQWQSVCPLPRPCVGMTSCMVGSVWCLLGGTNFTDPVKGECGPQECVYSIDLSSHNIASKKWKVLPDCPLYCSTAVAFGEFLVAVGGSDCLAPNSFNSSIFLFAPAIDRWLFIGNIPTPRSQTTCVVLSKGRLMVLGGKERDCRHSKTVEVLFC